MDEDSLDEPLDFGFPTSETDGEDEEVAEKLKITRPSSSTRWTTRSEGTYAPSSSNEDQEQILLVKPECAKIFTRETALQGAPNQMNANARPQNSSPDEDGLEEPLDFGFPTSSSEDDEGVIEEPRIIRAFSSPIRITRGEDIYTSSSGEDQPQKTLKKPGYKIFSRETALQKTQTHPQIQVEEKIQVDHRNMSIDETISKYRDYLDEDLINQQKPSIRRTPAQKSYSSLPLSPSGEIKTSSIRLQQPPGRINESPSMPGTSGNNPPREQPKSNQFWGEEQYLPPKRLSTSQSYDQNMHPEKPIYSPANTEATNRRATMSNEDRRGNSPRFIQTTPVAEENHDEYSPPNRTIQISGLAEKSRRRRPGKHERMRSRAESSEEFEAEIGSIDLSYRNRAPQPRAGSESRSTRAGPQSEFARSPPNLEQGSNFGQPCYDQNLEEDAYFNQFRHGPLEESYSTYSATHHRPDYNRPYMNQSMIYSQDPRQPLPTHHEDYHYIPPSRRKQTPSYDEPCAFHEDPYVQENCSNFQYEESWDPIRRSQSVMESRTRMGSYGNQPVERERPNSRASNSTTISRSRLSYVQPGRLPVQNNFVTINGDHYSLDDPQSYLAVVINMAIMTQFPEMVLIEKLPQLVQQLMGRNFIHPYYAFGRNWNQFIEENCPQIDINVLYNREYLCWRS
uniref:Uncharacterized protein n=1 Tax=Acrobeloides nanus TaxID=290746 RepID=A0A914D460_9BILA